MILEHVNLQRLVELLGQFPVIEACQRRTEMFGGQGEVSMCWFIGKSVLTPFYTAPGAWSILS